MPDRMGLPYREFLYTLDQIATLMGSDVHTVKQGNIYFEGRHTGLAPLDRMVARNIAEAGTRPDWRVSEREFVRWLKRKGFRIYDRAFMEDDRTDDGLPSRLKPEDPPA